MDVQIKLELGQMKIRQENEKGPSLQQTPEKVETLFFEMKKNVIPLFFEVAEKLDKKSFST